MWEVVAVSVKSVLCELLGRTCEGERGLDLEKQ